jgi:hypothetical protein
MAAGDATRLLDEVGEETITTGRRPREPDAAVPVPVGTVPVTR